MTFQQKSKVYTFVLLHLSMCVCACVYIYVCMDIFMYACRSVSVSACIQALQLKLLQWEVHCLQTGGGGPENEEESGTEGKQGTGL